MNFNTIVCHSIFGTHSICSCYVNLQVSNICYKYSTAYNSFNVYTIIMHYIYKLMKVSK